MISVKRYGWIVVSSDRDITDHAWSSGAVPVSGEDFLRIFENKLSSYSDTEEYEDDESKTAGTNTGQYLQTSNPIIAGGDI